MLRIVAIVGSPRRNGNRNYLVDQALADAGRGGVETEVKTNPALVEQSRELGRTMAKELLG